MVDLAGTTAANLNLDLVPVRRDELQHATWRPTFIGILLSPSQAGKPPPALYLSGRRFCVRWEAVARGVQLLI